MLFIDFSENDAENEIFPSEDTSNIQYREYYAGMGIF